MKKYIISISLIIFFSAAAVLAQNDKDVLDGYRYKSNPDLLSHKKLQGKITLEQAEKLQKVARLYLHQLEEETGPQGMEKYLYPPELVMEYQDEIGLSAEQKRDVKKAYLDAEVQFVDLKWELQEAQSTLEKELESSQVDEGVAMDKLEAVLILENRIKMLQLEAQIRVKNLLSDQQKMKLQQLRSTPASFNRLYIRSK